jgi:uncharacterized protein
LNVRLWLTVADPKLPFDLQPSAVQGPSPINVAIQDAPPISSFLSPLTPARLDQLHAQAAQHVVAEHQGRMAALVLVLREDAAFDGVNYLWSEHRCRHFLHVDPVVVGAALQGQAAGRLLYEHVLAFARQSGVPQVCCEFDIEPPNPVSAGFHTRFGFGEVGRQTVAGGSKQVSLQLAPVDASEA